MADEFPNQKKNSYIFAGVGAVLGGVTGVAIGGALAAIIGVGIGGLIGYKALTRL